MRTLYGAQFFSYMDVPWNPVEDLEKIEDYQPQLNDNFQLGGDFRYLYWLTEGDVTQNSNLLMQADLYLAITPADELLIYLEKGIGSAYEAFALYRGLPLHTVIKGGRFIPAYGWRFEDHKAYTRDYLGFSQYAQQNRKVIEDSGVEIGMYPMDWEITVALTNGGLSPVDNNSGKTITSRVNKRMSLGPVDMTLGLSHRYAEIGYAIPQLRYGGAFWGFSLGRLTYLGETDWILQRDVTSIVTSHIGILKIRSGWDMSVGYDFYDQNVDLKSGVDWRMKLAAEFFLTGYLQIAPAIYHHEEHGIIYQNAEVQFHVWF